MANTPDSSFKPTKILLPVDFSSSSQAALEAATGFAKQFHAEIYLVHIIPEFPDFNGSDFFPNISVLQERRGEIERKLTECKTFLKHQGIDAEFSIETGNDVVGNLLHVIEREQLNMVVLSTHGLSGWRPMVFGSIAEKMIKLVKCPLLLLHSVEQKVISAEPSLQIWHDTPQRIGTTENQHNTQSVKAVPLTPSQLRRLDVDAEEASERAGKTEERYDVAHSIFTK